MLVLVHIQSSVCPLLVKFRSSFSPVQIHIWSSSSLVIVLLQYSFGKDLAQVQSTFSQVLIHIQFNSSAAVIQSFSPVLVQFQITISSILVKFKSNINLKLNLIHSTIFFFNEFQYLSTFSSVIAHFLSSSKPHLDKIQS